MIEEVHVVLESFSNCTSMEALAPDIAAGISDRFLVTVEADKQDDTELVKSAVKALDLSKFAER